MSPQLTRSLGCRYVAYLSVDRGSTTGNSHPQLSSNSSWEQQIFVGGDSGHRKLAWDPHTCHQGSEFTKLGEERSRPLGPPRASATQLTVHP